MHLYLNLNEPVIMCPPLKTTKLVAYCEPLDVLGQATEAKQRTIWLGQSENELKSENVKMKTL